MKHWKKCSIGMLMMAMATGMGGGITAFSGQWVESGGRWWYQNDDGSYPANTWQWIDGNGDGIAECYYFDTNGWLLTNTHTPDGYLVDAEGHWVENGAIRTSHVSGNGGGGTGISMRQLAGHFQNDTGYMYDSYQATIKEDGTIWFFEGATKDNVYGTYQQDASNPYHIKAIFTSFYNVMLEMDLNERESLSNPVSLNIYYAEDLNSIYIPDSEQMTLFEAKIPRLKRTA